MLTFYADEPARRLRQIVADALLLLWCVVAVAAGRIVHERVLVARSGAQKLEQGSTSLAQNMTDAGDRMSKIPLVGGDARIPFDNAAATSRDLSSSGHDLASGLGRLAVVFGVLTALVPILLALVPWLFTRFTYALRAGRLAHLRAMPGGTRLLAMEALTTSRPGDLAEIHPDPVQAWQDGNPQATRELAALVLRTHGLNLPHAAREERAAGRAVTAHHLNTETYREPDPARADDRTLTRSEDETQPIVEPHSDS